MSEPSISEANKLLRVLKGERLKYTVRVHSPDGNILEFQSESRVNLNWLEADRKVWIVTEYPSSPICPFVEGMVILTEENPKV